MAKIPVKGTDIASYMPSLERRNQQGIAVLRGRNYYFDSKGPKSGFGSRLVVGLDSIEVNGGVVQSLDIGDRTFLFSSKGIYEKKGIRFSSTDEPYYVEIADFSEFPLLPNRELFKWTSAYLGGKAYVAHEQYGFFRFEWDGLTELTRDNTPGLPEDIVAICENNGRLVILSRYYYSWSAPSQPENFLPALGGAGQQLLRDVIVGRSMTLASFDNGVLVWTDTATMVAEFIGGDAVYRYDPVESAHQPLNAHCVDAMPDGSKVLCTKQGIHLVQNGRTPEIITPQFNEFFRAYLKDTQQITVRLNYCVELDQLFVQCRDFTNHYVHTWVLNAALDKWGQFSDGHLGIVRFESLRGAYGYVDIDGVVHQFMDTFTRESLPDVYVGLDAWLEVGYPRPPELQMEVDTLLEFHEVNLGGRAARPSWIPNRVDDLGVLEPNWDPSCPLLDVDFNFTERLILFQGTTVSIEDMATGTGLDDLVLEPSGLLVPAWSANAWELSTPGQFMDMTGWTMNVRYRAASSASNVLGREWRVGQPDTPNYGLNACGAGTTVNDPPTLTNQAMLQERFTVFSVMLHRCRALEHWSREGDPAYLPLLEPIGTPFNAAYPCGVTAVFTLNCETEADTEYGPLWFIQDSDFPSNYFVFEVRVFSEDDARRIGIRLRSSDGNIVAVRDYGLVNWPDPSTVKVGVTFHRFILSPSVGRAYSMTARGLTPETDTFGVVNIYQGREANLETFLFMNHANSTSLPSTIRVKGVAFMNAVDDTALAALTEI